MKGCITAEDVIGIPNLNIYDKDKIAAETKKYHGLLPKVGSFYIKKPEDLEAASERLIKENLDLVR